MRPILLFAFLSVIISEINCQTLDETAQWIKEKIESHDLMRFTFYEARDVREECSYSVDFSVDGEMLIGIERSLYGFNVPPTSYSIYSLPVKLIKEVTYSYGDGFFCIGLSTNGGDSNSDPIELRICDENWNVLETENLRELGINLDKSFSDSDLPNRFVKAMNHLVELYGGALEKEAF